jgi:hypothetical protein
MTMQVAISQESVPQRAKGNVDDLEYAAALVSFQNEFRGRLGDELLFTTDAEGLWDAYIEAFPADERQFHRCNSCKRFVETYGALVSITESGLTIPAMWNSDEWQGDELAAIAAMERIVRKAKVTGPFLSKEAVWGHPITGVWRHLSVVSPKVYTSLVNTAGQAMAEKRQDYLNVRRALSEFEAPAVNQALALLNSEALFRSEKVLAPTQWLSDLHAALAAAPKQRRDNVLWRFVAAAPAGFCHPRSSMIGTLLEDIAAGLPFEDAARKFRLKMDPMHYQRPQAAPSAGNIEASEKLVAKLGIARSLERRFARLEELETVWRPAPAAQPSEPSSAVFAHLKAKGAAPAPTMTVPAQNITWAKFAATVLPQAKAIEALVPHGSAHFFATLTAEHLDAPPILQWDNADRRNPFSWYTYSGGSQAAQWGMAGGMWTKVTAISLRPSLWSGSFAHQGTGAMLVLEGCKDSVTNQGNALFPETLKSELHGARATIEAFSRVAKLGGAEQASACGLEIVGTRVRVTDGNGVRAEFKIDRWS